MSAEKCVRCLPRSRKIYGAGHDQAILNLGINADLRSVFNWNVKQLFVYITAEYETEANVLNQVVVWDTIVNDVSQVRRASATAHFRGRAGKGALPLAHRSSRPTGARRRRGSDHSRLSTSTA